MRREMAGGRTTEAKVIGWRPVGSVAIEVTTGGEAAGCGATGSEETGGKTTRGTGPERNAAGRGAMGVRGTEEKAIDPLDRIPITSITIFPPSLKSFTISGFVRKAAKLQAMNFER